MKKVVYFFLLCLFLCSCGTTKNAQMTDRSTSCELVIFWPEFDSWLQKQPPSDNYNLHYLKNKNREYVNEYNRRAMSPSRGNMYPQPINYFPDQEYGRKLNYRLFMYFEFFQKKYDQDL